MVYSVITPAIVTAPMRLPVTSVNHIDWFGPATMALLLL